MVNYTCSKCEKIFTQKGQYNSHLKRKTPCKKENEEVITSKRISLSPLRYAGGKTKAIGLILESFPKLKNKKVISPFFGGGSFETESSKNICA